MIACMFPGQGAQRVGMGADLFPRYPDLVAKADAVLGYSLAELCTRDPHGLLNRTDRTQPALFAVSALAWLARRDEGRPLPGLVMGHSLGEFTALFAAGALDFETALTLVRERGRLMNEAQGGSMLAIIGLQADRCSELLAAEGLEEVDIANFNAPQQTVLAGLRDDLDRAAKVFQDAGAIPIPINVSAAFHSRWMRPASEAFAEVVAAAAINDPALPVVSNVTARPYPLSGAADTIRRQLARQIVAPVRWVECMHYALARGVTRFEEVGPGDILTKLEPKIRAVANPVTVEDEPAAPAAPSPTPAAPSAGARRLGAEAFRVDFGTTFAYAAGAMYKAIAGPDMVIRLGRAGMLGFLGTGGVAREQVAADIRAIRAALGDDRPWGVNLLSRPDRPAAEMAMADLLIAEGVPAVEAAAFLRITPALVRVRFHGARRGPDGTPTAARRVLAKVSRPEIAALFMAPAPDDIIDGLLDQGLLSDEEGWCARHAPVAHHICVEADSGGHTDQRSLVTALPAICRLRDRLAAEHSFAQPICIGAAGGVGTPEAAAAAFLLGADFVLTGSINQCTVEAATSDVVKDILQDLDIQDTAYAPAGDMFELGAKVQVAAKGLFFAARANKLFELYRRHESLDQIDARTREQIETRFFGRSLEDVWADTRAHYGTADPALLAEAERVPKLRMALVFKWYFLHTTRLALDGTVEYKVNFQIHTGPAMGACNAWLRGGPLEDWRARHVDDIGRRIMEEAANLIEDHLSRWMKQKTA